MVNISNGQFRRGLADRREGLFRAHEAPLYANPEQNITWSSGTSFLQPLNIVPPRLARIGAKLEW